MAIERDAPAAYRHTSGVRLATWNIRAGGGRRIERIARVIHEEGPDVLVLTEFRPVPGRQLLELLKPLDYNVVCGVPTGVQNCVCVLSRLPIHSVSLTPSPKSVHRWVHVVVNDLDLAILAVHVPNQNEVWNKREFWECVLEFASMFVDKRSVIIGDLNTALDEDCEGDPIREAVYFKRLLEAGWVDAWRHRHGAEREFSWFSHHSNGFRIDHCLVSPSLAGTIVGSSMRHDVRTDRLSDHSLLSVELGLRTWQKATQRGRAPIRP